MRWLLFLALLISCTSERSKEKIDTVDVAKPDTFAVSSNPTETTAEIPQKVYTPPDTVYETLTFESNPTTVQMDSLVAYVYNENGLNVYEVTREHKIETVVGHLPYRTQVTLLSPLKYDPELTVDGMKGYYALIQYQNKTGYIFTGYLLNIPVPPEITSHDGPDFLNYLIATLSLTKPVTKRKPENADQWTFEIEFEFEGGITFSSSYYGHVGFKDELYIPNLGMQQGLLLARHWLIDLNERIGKEMPTKAVKEMADDMLYQVRITDGTVTSMELMSQGPGYHEIIEVVDGGILITHAGGD